MNRQLYTHMAAWQGEDDTSYRIMSRPQDSLRGMLKHAMPEWCTACRTSCSALNIVALDAGLSCGCRCTTQQVKQAVQGNQQQYLLSCWVRCCLASFSCLPTPAGHGSRSNPRMCTSDGLLVQLFLAYRKHEAPICYRAPEVRCFRSSRRIDKR